MKRRHFLTGSITAVASTSVAMPAVAQSSPVVKWRMASSFPKSSDVIWSASLAVADAVAEMTDGQFTIQVFAAGELVPPLQVAEAVTNATVQMGHTGAYFYIGTDTAFAMGGQLPWMSNARQFQAWLYSGGGNDLFNDFLKGHNLFNLPAGNTGAQMAGWYRKEINSMDDLQGLKMRIGGLGGSLLKRLGVVPQQIPLGDIYPALEKGVIDALELVGPLDDEKMGFVKIAPYYYYPGFWEGSSELSYFINLDQWNALPKQYQAALKHATRSAGLEQLTKYDAGNTAALRRLVSAGAQLRALPEDILRESYKQSRLMFAEMSDANPNFKKLYDHMNSFMADSNVYLEISDLYFDWMKNTARRKGWDKI